MKKQYLPLVLALALCQNVSAQSRFDAGAQIYADYYLNFVREPGAVQPELHALPFELNPNSRSEITAEIMAVLNDGTTAEDLESFGLEVRGIIGKVAICTGSMDDIIALADTDLTLRISFPEILNFKLDKSRAASASGVDQVHSGEGLEMPYKGQGVITGIFDIGMDPNHVNFKNSTLTESRIKNLWSYNRGGNVSAYTTPQAIAAFTTDNSANTHGTHTMGCMAGSYNGNGDFYTVAGLSLSGAATMNRNKPIPYYGMAPEAEIAAACGYNSSTNIVLACQQLASYIKSSGKPGLISLSFGGLMGPHDNTGESVMALNEIAKDVPFFIAAGNEGADGTSLIGTFSSNLKSVKTFLKPTNNSGGNGIISIWSGDDRPLTLRIVVYDRTSKEEVFSHTLSTEGNVKITNSNFASAGNITSDIIDMAFIRTTITAEQKLSRVNNRCQIEINSNIVLASGNGSQRYVFGIEVSGADGQHFDLVNGRKDGEAMQLELTGWDIPGWSDGGNDMSISDLACGTNMISIGAWNTRRSWANLDGSVLRYPDAAFDVNKISPFSSYGTLADGRTLPMVCAPGAGIISSISSYYYSAMGYSNADVAATTKFENKNYYYESQQGTSMATPIAAGICALWLQANHHLTPADVRYIIQNTSTTVNDPGNEVRWGAGKINALEGLKMAVKIGAGVSDVVVNPADIIITGNGNNWQVVAPGAAAVKTVVYDLNGRPVITSDVKGDTAEICGENLQPGIYVINVNGTLSRRVAVK